jgi:hypothetical protein
MLTLVSWKMGEVMDCVGKGVIQSAQSRLSLVSGT